MVNKICSVCFILCCVFTACQPAPHAKETQKHPASKTASKPVKSQKTMEPAEKTETKQTPVSFTSNTGDDEETNDFVVNVSPTAKDNVFHVDIHYGKNDASDDLTFPPKSFFEKAAIRPGKDSDHCIVGFLDKKGKFNELVEISGSVTSIGIKKLKYYYVQ